MRLLFASSEIYPLAKTGGLADVAASLPAALGRRGVDVRLLMPAYAGVAVAAEAKAVARLGNPFGLGDSLLLEGHHPDSGNKLWLLDHPILFNRAGGPYQDAAGADWPDNDMRFALLAWTAARLCRAESPMAWKPNLLHLNDWQTGLAAAYLRAWGGARPGVVFTIHNMAYQGNFAAERVPQLGFPWSFYTMQGFEFWGRLSCLKAGLVFADKLTTVSPTYAGEIQTPSFGFGMDGVLAGRAKDLSGILNGADYKVWDPAIDPHLPQRYGPDQLVDGKAANKAAVQSDLGLDTNPAAPLLVVISRLSDQKGMDLLLAVMPAVLRSGAQLALLGSGDKGLEDAFSALAAARPGQVAVHIGYSEGLAHRLQAGGDLLLMPSRFEPCGLSQIYALRYGTLPVVHGTGGLADTVVDATFDALLNRTATGFVFDQPTASAFQWCIERAVGFFRSGEHWRPLQRQAMQQDFGWDQAAARYLDLYRSLRPNGAPAKSRRKAHL